MASLSAKDRASNTDDPDRIFSSEVIFALSHASRNQLFKNYFDPTRVPNYVFRMDNDLMNNLIFGGTATGGNQDDYRYRVNWVVLTGISINMRIWRIPEK